MAGMLLERRANDLRLRSAFCSSQRDICCRPRAKPICHEGGKVSLSGRLVARIQPLLSRRLPRPCPDKRDGLGTYKLLDLLAPRAGFEPATNRLTDRVRVVSGRFIPVRLVA